jgi:drug/metabolite transporter (DMT)-like permease
MSWVVLGLVAGAALMHAGWNALLKEAEDPLRLAAQSLTAVTVVATPVAAVIWLVAGRPGLPAAAWGLAAASALCELVYFNLLSSAYRQGELSVVYPLARGTAPVLAVGIGIVVLGERLRLVGLVGVAFLLAGIWAVRKPAAAGKAVLPALGTGVMIAIYSALDRVGVRLGPPLLYGWVLWILTAALLWGWVAFRGRPVSFRAGAAGPALVVGALMTGAYLAVLVAFSLAPLSIVSPLRESAIVLVTAWGIWRLRERQDAWLRLGGAGLIVAGIALLALG